MRSILDPPGSRSHSSHSFLTTSTYMRNNWFSHLLPDFTSVYKGSDFKNPHSTNLLIQELIQEMVLGHSPLSIFSWSLGGLKFLKLCVKRHCWPPGSFTYPWCPKIKGGRNSVWIHLDTWKIKKSMQHFCHHTNNCIAVHGLQKIKCNVYQI